MEKFTFHDQQGQSFDFDLVSAVEAVLFAAGEPIEISQFETLEVTPLQIQAALDELDERLQGSGLVLQRTATTCQIRTDAAFYPLIVKILGSEKKASLSRAASEALAVIAYRQPVTRIDIDQVRGVGSSAAVMRLSDLGLIEECGRLEAPGRPYLYRTTPEFLQLCGIQTLEELPEWEKYGLKAHIDEEHS